VAPAHAKAASSILSRPLAEKYQSAAEDEMEMTEEYVEPACPACGAVEPVLESVDPANQWRCEACGNVWMDDPNY
jgi:predicted RNA-binding Zn-ribbon protein involved in translation (DUF1610 family)